RMVSAPRICVPGLICTGIMYSYTDSTSARCDHGRGMIAGRVTPLEAIRHGSGTIRRGQDGDWRGILTPNHAAAPYRRRPNGVVGFRWARIGRSRVVAPVTMQETLQAEGLQTQPAAVPQ